MTVTDIANEIFIEHGSPTSTSIPAIAFWVRAKIGAINNLLLETFTFDASYEIVNANGDQISIEAVAIIKKLYKIYDYENQIRTHMNAISQDTILEVSDQGSSVRKINRSEVSKTLAGIKKEEEASLKELVHSYRNRLAAPTQVTGDDTVEGNYSGNGIPDYRTTI